MKIYFCDGCNESVPLVDVQSGRITTIKGKLFCSNCIPPGAVGPQAAPAGAAPRRSVSPIFLVLVLLLLGWTVWRDRSLILPDSAPLTDVELDERNPLKDLELRTERVDQQVMQLMADSQQTSRALTSLRGDLEALRAADADQSRGTERLADEIDRLARTQAEMSRVIEQVQHNANRTDGLTSRVDALSDSVAAHQALLSMGTVTSGDGVVTLDDMGAGPAAGSVPAVDPARTAEIEELRRQLRDPAPDLRFEAVDRVESGRYVELGPDLVSMLGDEDMFVRLHAMHALETLAYEDAVPALFDVLGDDHAAIRKQAAEALVGLTGFDPGYDSKGSKSERAKGLKEWRDWYAAR